MKFLPALGLAALLLPACAIPGDAAWSDLHGSASVAGYAHSFKMSGTGISVDDSSGGGSDFSGDLDLADNTENVLYSAGRIGFAPFELSVARMTYDGSNAGTVTSGTEFGGQPISGDLDVNSEMDMSMSKVLLGIDLFNSPAFRIGLLAGVDYLEVDQFDLISQESQGPGSVQAGDVQTILENQEIPIPLLGFRVDVALPFNTRLGGELSGMDIEYDDADVGIFDWDIAAQWEIFWHIELMVGYRSVFMELDGEVDGTSMVADLEFEGPYAGITIYL